MDYTLLSIAGGRLFETAFTVSKSLPGVLEPTHPGRLSVQE